ncbi:hypothetical protein [Dickeya fangzhongdai]|uniref:hypothetical protein n=1 Tax=Dickeya fangzhongdai TaxID=1778540 RepID=UPI0026E0A828|nr:hypothetical protein [Dickeya fangzhongdai]WKV50724.1 hypothetical protein PL145_23505 [Dickeya fangzhongdai]
MKNVDHDAGKDKVGTDILGFYVGLTDDVKVLQKLEKEHVSSIIIDCAATAAAR